MRARLIYAKPLCATVMVEPRSVGVVFAGYGDKSGTYREVQSIQPQPGYIRQVTELKIIH